MFWQRRPDGRVYIYARADGRTRTLPRAQSKHLDSQPDEVVRVFVDSIRPRLAQERPVSDEGLTDLVARYRDFLVDCRLDANTIYNKTSPLLLHVIPFFITQAPPLLDPMQWKLSAPKLLQALRSKGLTDSVIQRTNGAFRGFWRWLREEGLVLADAELLLRSPRNESRSTPLQFTLTPADVLAFARTAEPEIGFIALLGFFFSLRPQEVFAVTKGNFRAGSKAAELECCKVMQHNNLFCRLAVHVTKQLSKTTGALKEPKAHSKGWVACFDEDAARLVLAYLQSVDDVSARATRFTVHYQTARWRRQGMPGITLKDLRRASIYWLGHYSGMGLTELRNHARHTKSTTTDLYTRRPADPGTDYFDLDLDA